MPRLPKSSKCFGCSLCTDVCPTKSIKLIYNKNGFLTPIIDRNKCIKCNLCEKRCPGLHFHDTKPNNITQTKPYMGWSKNDEIRIKSSSGGIFTQIAYDFLQRDKSIVVGAALINNLDVRHIFIEDCKDLYKIQGTKYKQSNLSGIYAKCILLLKKGYRILFSGTPCQIAALKQFIGNNIYDGKIFYIELICHGVPSNLIIELCLNRQNAIGIKAFRTKNKGWQNSQRMIYVDSNNNEKEIQKDEIDYFYQAFHNKMNLRQCCYKCQFAQLPRIGDLTIGDFWGNNNIENSDKGISVILVNSNCCSELLSDNIFLEKIHWRDFLKYNSPIYTPFGKSCSFSSFLFIFKFLPNRIALKLLSTTYEKNLLNAFYYLWHKFFYKWRRRIYERNEIKANEIIEYLEKYEQK